MPQKGKSDLNFKLTAANKEIFIINRGDGYVEVGLYNE